jgi:hypothetical protein
MRRVFLPLFGLLFLTSPAFAISYSTSAFLDLSTLSFSGISTSSLSSGSQSQTQHTFITGSTTGFSNEPSWLSAMVTQEDPQFGTAVAIAGPNLMTSSITYTGPSGGVSSFVYRDAAFTANSTGYLTASIQYGLAQGGVLANSPLQVGGSNVQMDFVFLSNGISDALATHGSVVGDGSRTGILSLTQWFNAGQEARLSLSAASFASSVPVPDVLWPTLAGLISLAILAERTRRLRPI